MTIYRFVSNDGGTVEIEADDEHEARIELLGRLGWGLCDDSDEEQSS